MYAIRSYYVQRLARVPGALSLLAYADGQPAGLLNAFLGFSTFAAAPLLNIHDLIVNRDYRGRITSYNVCYTKLLR